MSGSNPSDSTTPAEPAQQADLPSIIRLLRFRLRNGPSTGFCPVRYRVYKLKAPQLTLVTNLKRHPWARLRSTHPYPPPVRPFSRTTLPNPGPNPKSKHDFALLDSYIAWLHSYNGPSNSRGAWSNEELQYYRQRNLKQKEASAQLLAERGYFGHWNWTVRFRVRYSRSVRWLMLALAIFFIIRTMEALVAELGVWGFIKLEVFVFGSFCFWTKLLKDQEAVKNAFEAFGVAMSHEMRLWVDQH